MKNSLLINDLQNIGLERGDTVLVRADIGKMLKLNSGLKTKDILDSILYVVGENGTVVAPAYTRTSFIKKDKNNCFTKKSRTTSGLFSMIMLANENSFRSSHPTNSHVAIGKNAKYILEDHDENSGAYDPTRKIMNLSGKMLLLGCVSSSLGFNTVHLAEADLKIHRKIILPTMNTSFYEKNGEIKLFKRKDPGLCTANYYKLFGLYIKNELLKQGYIGGVQSLLIDANDAYRIDFETLKENLKFNICDDINCMQCRARRWDNLQDLPFFVIRKILKKLGKMIKKRKG